MSRTLYDKLWDDHVIYSEEDGTATIYIDRQLLHEVTSPQAFEGLNLAGRPVWRISANLAVSDHNVPTTDRSEGIADPISKLQVDTLDQNCDAFGITQYKMNDTRQGIVHVIGPEQGATLPGMTVVCGDSHTSTHGAFGALAFGIGTSEVEHVLATQTLLMKNCNMAIEAGARAGLVAVDETTIEYLQGRPYAPKGDALRHAMQYWRTLHSDPGAKFDAVVELRAEEIAPQVTWGTSPEMVLPISDRVPDPEKERDLNKRDAMERALQYMNLTPNTPLSNITVDKVFIGSCTNSRIEDLRAAAKIVDRIGKKIAPNIKLALVVPGSGLVKAQAEREGLDRVFKAAGFEWREPGCSMCLAMNADRLEPGERCASTSNRNFEGRQGNGGRTHLVSPAMAAAAAIEGHFVDIRKIS